MVRARLSTNGELWGSLGPFRLGLTRRYRSRITAEQYRSVYGGMITEPDDNAIERYLVLEVD